MFDEMPSQTDCSILFIPIYAGMTSKGRKPCKRNACCLQDEPNAPQQRLTSSEGKRHLGYFR